MLPKSKNIAIFGSINNKKRILDALFLIVRNSRKIQVKIKDEATGDVRGWCFTSPYFAYTEKLGIRKRLFTGVRDSPLLFYLDRQCEKPRAVGQRRVEPHALFLYPCRKWGRRAMMSFPTMKIGERIKSVFDAMPKSYTVEWFARQLNCDRRNVYRIFQKENMDIHQLADISKILGHDFFADLSRELEKNNQ